MYNNGIPTHNEPADHHITKNARFAAVRYAQFHKHSYRHTHVTAPRNLAVIRIPGGTAPRDAYLAYERENRGPDLRKAGMSGRSAGVVDLTPLAIVRTRHEAEAVVHVAECSENPSDLDYITKKLGVTVRELAKLDPALIDQVRSLAATSVKAAAWIRNYDRTSPMRATA